MVSENDNGPGGRDEPKATPTVSVVAPLAPPRPVAAAKYWDGGVPVSVAAAVAPVAGGSSMPEFAPPRPLAPSRYPAAKQAPAPVLAPPAVVPSFPKPSIAATLPPPLIDMIQAAAPVLRVTPEVAQPVEAPRLKLAPEVPAARPAAVSFGRDPAAAAPVKAPEPARTPQPVAPQVSPVLQAPQRADAPAHIKSVAAQPVRIEPVFAPRAAAPAPDALAVVASDVPAPSAPERSAGYYVKTAAKFVVYAAAAWLALIAFLILAYRVVNPPMSSLMLQQWLSGQAIAQSWVDIDSISPQVVRAVLLSEDGRFCEHSGVDFDAMQDAIEKAGDGGIARGASTISMQVVKNLFLWPSKSYVRKAIEIPLTWAMEFVWPKRRIMEIYLNIAEWGPGIFGVEAASQFHFQKSARRLNEREAAQLAVALPNPYMRDAGDPGPKTRRLASDIQGRMRNAYHSQTACVLAAGAAGR